MKSLKTIVLILATVVLLGSSASAEMQACTNTPTPQIVHRNVFPLVLDGRDYDLIMFVIDFPKGAGFPMHFHGGNALVTVLSGEMTLLQNDAERSVKTGEIWTERPGDVHSVVNKGEQARVSAVMLLPRGAPETTLVK